MSRTPRDDSGENGLLSPGRPRRVTIMNSNEDLFLNLAKDEPAHTQDADSQNQAGSRIQASKSNTGSLSNGDLYRRRSASAQRNALPSAAADEARVRQHSSRPSLPPAVPDYLRDPPSDRITLSSNEHQVRRSPNSFSRAFMPAAVGNYSSDQSLRERHNPFVRDILGASKSHLRTNLRPSNRAYETPTPNGAVHPSQQHISPEATPALQSPTDGAESVGSTTAASTVWDELEELRLRIRRLEHSGNRARSSGVVQDDAADRPHTATTMTTSSSVSHPLKRLGSPPDKTLRPSNVPSHPLLQSALAKAQEIVDPEIYQSLEASISDAMAISMLATANSETPHNLNGSSNTLTTDAFSDKRLRRKTDGLCRSLTELCIALCEDAPRQRSQALSHRASGDLPFQETVRGTEQSPLTYLDERRARLDRSRSAPHRPSSRVSGYGGGSVVESTRQPNPSSLASRQSLSSRWRRRSSIAEDDEDETVTRSLSRAATDFSQDDGEDHDPTVRAPSRALSETQSARRSPSRDLQKFSRDYTSRHPLPSRPGPSTRQSFSTVNQSNVSLNSARASLTNPRSHRGADSRSASRMESPLEPSPTLAERLAHRRQQQQVVTTGRLGDFASATNESAKPYSFLGSRRPASSGRASRYDQEAGLD